jgi:hypothetical protein
MPEGVSFAILLMNIVTPLIDKYIRPKPFGYKKPEKVKKPKNNEKNAELQNNERYFENRFGVKHNCNYFRRIAWLY